MFLRRHRKEAGREDYQYWSLVKTVRTARGPRHQIVARLGKLDGAEVQAARLMPPGHKEVGWDVVSCILTLGRFCAQPNELSPAERCYEDTALEDLLGVPMEKINDARLYRGLDVLLEHKEALCVHLLERYRDWFGVGFEFLLYDVTSTYFEGLALRNAKVARDYSRDDRPDCKQVFQCFFNAAWCYGKSGPV